jgi:transcriptional regulator with XRE-family HTH domain
VEVLEISERSVIKLNAPLIRFALRARGWSQAQLARAIGVDQSTVSRALGDEGVTTMRVAKQIMDAFEGRLRLEEVLDIPGMTPENPQGIV